MLDRVWIIVGTARIFAKQNGDHLVEILDLLHTDCDHVIIGIKPCHLTASGKYLTAPERFPRADWQHKFLVTGPNPLSKRGPCRFIVSVKGTQLETTRLHKPISLMNFKKLIIFCIHSWRRWLCDKQQIFRVLVDNFLEQSRGHPFNIKTWHRKNILSLWWEYLHW